MNAPNRYFHFSKRMLLFISAVSILTISGITFFFIKVREDNKDLTGKENDVKEVLNTGISNPEYFNFDDYTIIEEKSFDLDKDGKEEKILCYSEDKINADIQHPELSYPEDTFINIHFAILKRNEVAGRYEKIWDEKPKSEKAYARFISTDANVHTAIYDKDAEIPKIKFTYLICLATKTKFQNPEVKSIMTAFNGKSGHFEKISFFMPDSSIKDAITVEYTQPSGNNNVKIRESVWSLSQTGAEIPHEYIYEWSEDKFGYLAKEILDKTRHYKSDSKNIEFDYEYGSGRELAFKEDAESIEGRYAEGFIKIAAPKIVSETKINDYNCEAEYKKGENSPIPLSISCSSRDSSNGFHIFETRSKLRGVAPNNYDYTLIKQKDSQSFWVVTIHGEDMTFEDVADSLAFIK